MRADARGRGAPPSHGDPAPHGWCSWRESESQKIYAATFADLAGTPAGMLVLYVHDEVLDLKRKLVGVAVGTPAAVGQPLNAALLITIEDLVACLSRDPKLPAKFRHRLAG